MNIKYFFFLIFMLLATPHTIMGQTQMEMNQKAHDDFAKADAELNKVYKQLIKLLDETEKQLLITAQKDWVKFRDSHCAFEAHEYEGGSIQPLMHSTCLTERTNSRIDDLKAILEDRNR